MKEKITLAITIIFFQNGFSQPAIQWQNTIGGSNYETLYIIQQTIDGGYIMGGFSASNISGDKTENSNGGNDYWIVKTDASGNIQWQNTIGGSGDDRLWSLQQTADGGYILGGYSDSNISGDKTENSNGMRDYWIVKTDGSGNIQWQNTIGGNNDDYLYSIKQSADGGYILGGDSWSDISGDKTENSNGGYDYWLVKTDSAGSIQWQNTIGGSGNDALYSIQQTSDGGYILGGFSDSNISGDKTENSNGDSDYWIVKTDASGNIQWQNTIGGSDLDGLYSIQQTADGGYIMGGKSYSNISGDKTENNWDTTLSTPDYWVVKTDAAGSIQWQNTIGGNDYENINTIQQTDDGGYIMGGGSSSNISGDKAENSIGFYDYWIVKTDSAGNIQWQNTLGGNAYDWLGSIRQTVDGGYILGGTSGSNISGDKTENSMGFYDYWIIKLAPYFVGFDEIVIERNNISLSPNPATSELRIENPELKIEQIEIFNVLGEKVFAENQEPVTKNQEVIDVSSLTSGIYFVKVRGEKEEKVVKFMKQ